MTKPPSNHRTKFGFLNVVQALALLVTLLSCAVISRAETLRKRYTLPYDKSVRRASSLVAAKEARKRLIRDFIAAKFAPEISTRFAEEIDIALDPADQYLTAFEVVSEKLNEDETQLTITVQADLDLVEIVNALVENKVLSFGSEPPKVMIFPSDRFADPQAAKTLRALMYEQIKKSGLRPVAFESSRQTVSVRIKDKITPTALERQALIRSATEYGADYLIFIDTEVNAKPFTQGGYIVDATFIHTILRPNGALILGESVNSERGSGSSPILAFDRALDSVAPVISKVAIAQLYQAIYSDSDIIYSTPKLKEEKSIVINFGSSTLVQEVVRRLELAGAKTQLQTAMTGTSAKAKIETSMDDVALWEWFNQQTFRVNGKTFKTPVVAFAENTIEVEAVADEAKPTRQPSQAPLKKPRPSTGTANRLDILAVLKLRPARIN
ncbi:MAG TPA: hypothetical protein VN844_12130 [Pyrinomonadaceae bacterium]|nr:hypothetical protein [Pyrinomonadaceae bacterium]